ncbi:MAG: radical SAM protein [bacterium]
MAKRILLMNPPSGLYRRDDRCQSKVDDQTVRVIFPPIEFGVLGAVARQHGAEVIVRDYPAARQDMRAFQRDLESFKPDIILLNTTIHTIDEDLETFRIAKQQAPDTLAMARGESVAVFAEKVMAGHPELDIVLAGEPEATFAEILDGYPRHEIAGVVWRSQDGVIHANAERPLTANLDDLPLPARELFDNTFYRSPENGRMITVIHAQRGCPSKCIFCPAGSMSGYTVRERSVDNVMREITECAEKYGIRDFLFHGDTFTLHKRWVIDLCKAIVDSGLLIHWGCNSRADTIDNERAQWLRRAGCWVVAFGFEHGVQEMLDKMKKGARAERAHEAAAICRRNGLKVHGFFVIGLPWETRQTLEATLRFARSLKLDFFDFNIAYPLPGTELYEIADREELFEIGDQSIKGGYAKAALRTYKLSSEELTAWRKWALLRMYSSPGYIYRTLAHAAASGNLPHYFRAAFHRLTSLLRNQP